MSQKTATREEPHNMMQQDRSSHSITKEDLARHRTTREEHSSTVQIAAAAAAAAAAKSLQLYPTLCDPIDGSPPGSSVPGILQARILEWVAMTFSRGSSPSRDRTWVSSIAGCCCCYC